MVQSVEKTEIVRLDEAFANLGRAEIRHGAAVLDKSNSKTLMDKNSANVTQESANVNNASNSTSKLNKSNWSSRCPRDSPTRRSPGRRRYTADQANQHHHGIMSSRVTGIASGCRNVSRLLVTPWKPDVANSW